MSPNAVRTEGPWAIEESPARPALFEALARRQRRGLLLPGVHGQVLLRDAPQEPSKGEARRSVCLQSEREAGLEGVTELQEDTGSRDDQAPMVLHQIHRPGAIHLEAPPIVARVRRVAGKTDRHRVHLLSLLPLLLFLRPQPVLLLWRGGTKQVAQPLRAPGRRRMSGAPRSNNRAGTRGTVTQRHSRGLQLCCRIIPPKAVEQAPL
mmetsp:Transcript_119640/g.208340  ORF Transcript_119640/g.208340 Transcript_119640/m.208340 type:complete len:207 (+) Transcript_119640:1437-2057(+)